jgi:putative toxin of predicted polymorphic toxin system
MNRGSFVANVRAWRANQKALEKALLEGSGVSQAEVNAFLNAQIRVTKYVQKFMNASDWFLDSPVPADVRAAVDGALKQAFDELADALKDNLNEWQAGPLTPEEELLSQTISAFGAGIAAVEKGGELYFECMQEMVTRSAHMAIGFVPVVGTGLDLCEAVSGKEWCLPSGRELSVEERIFAGVGVVISGAPGFVKGVKNAGISQTAKQVLTDIDLLGEEFTLALRASRRSWYKGLNGNVTREVINAFERKAGLHLMKKEGRAMIGVGDGGVREVLDIPKQSPIKNGAKAPDFLTVTKGNKLALSEAKGGAEISLGMDDEVLGQLNNALKKLKELNLLCWTMWSGSSSSWRRQRSLRTTI